MARVVVVTVALLMQLAACASPVQRDAQGLQAALLSEPADRDARVALARLRLREGQRGQALRIYARLERTGSLGARDRTSYRELSLERAKARLALGDPRAILDRKAAGGKLEPVYYALAAVCLLRHSSQFERDKAKSYLKGLSPSDPRREVAEPTILSHAQQTELIDWLYAAGAKREALRVAEIYARTGGREPTTLQIWRDLHSWWYGDSFPALPSEAAELTLDPPDALAVLVNSLEALATGEGAAAVAEDWKVPEFATVLQEIQRAYARDPALADRVAQNFVNRSVYGVRERALVTELFFRLGDAARARAFATQLRAISGSMPAFAMATGLATAATGDTEAAELYFTAAAAGSGDPGAYWAIAARVYRGLGANLAAVGAARKALSLTARGNDLGILADLIAAQRALGREPDAKESEAALFERVAKDQHPKIRELLIRDAERGPLPSLLDPIKKELGF